MGRHPEYDHLMESAQGDSTCRRRECGHSFDLHSVLEPGCGCSLKDCKGRIEEVTGDAVIDEISAEIDRGDAHLMTRNELVEFIDWWVLREDDLDANTLIYDAMEKANGVTIPLHLRERIAKEFFIEKGYE